MEVPRAHSAYIHVCFGFRSGARQRSARDNAAGAAKKYFHANPDSGAAPERQ
jgi:uncharacterized protein YcbK (DUF882 family)